MPFDSLLELNYSQPINWAHALNRGRVAWWLGLPLRYGMNDWPDLVQGASGVLASFTSGLGWNTASNPGGAASLLGTASSGCYVRVATTPTLLVSLPFTLAFWAKTSTTNNEVIFECNGNSGFSVQSSSVSGLIHFNCGAGGQGVNSSVAFNDGKWHRIVLVAQANSGSCYIDRINRTTIQGSGCQAPSYAGAPYYFFSRGGSFGFDGSLNDLCVWNRPLAQAEILADYWLSQEGYPDVLNYDEPTTAIILAPTGTPANVNISPVEFGWNAPPATTSADANTTLAPVEFAWNKPSATASVTTFTPNPVPATARTSGNYGDLNVNQPVNLTHPINRGRVLWWLATPNSYGTNDFPDLCLGSNGVLTNMSGGSGWSFANNPGGVGSILFNGTTSRVNCGRPPGTSIASAISIAAWIYLNSTTTSWYISNSQGSWALENNAGKLQLVQPGGGGPTFLASATTLSTGQWYHIGVAASWNGSSWTYNYYINGKPDRTTSQTSAGVVFGSPSFNLQLGCNQSGTNTYGSFFSGYMNDVAIWNRAITAKDFGVLYWQSQQSYPEMLNWVEADAIDTLLSPGGTSATVNVAPDLFAWNTPPVTPTGAATVAADVTELGWIAPPVTPSGVATVAADVVELGWITPPVEVSTGANASVTLSPVEFAWIAPPPTVSGAAQVALDVVELGWITPPTVASVTADASVALSPVEMAWITPPVEVSTGTNVSISIAPVELAWIAPPVTLAATANIGLAPKEMAWDTPPVTAVGSGSTTINLAPVEMAWITPPVVVSAGVGVAADVVAFAFNQVGAQASATLTQVFVFPCGLVFAKVSAGFVGQIPTPDIIFTDLQRKPIYT